MIALDWISLLKMQVSPLYVDMIPRHIGDIERLERRKAHRETPEYKAKQKEYQRKYRAKMKGYCNET